MTPEQRLKLIDLLVDYGVNRKYARKASSTAILALRFQEMDWRGIYHIFVTGGGFERLDPLLSAQAASEWLRTYIAETTSGHLAKWAGIMMYVGDSQALATDWLRHHGYFDQKAVN